MKNCIFCKIISGDIPSMKVYEDDVCYAFLDINPDTDGHTLVVPKNHYTDINDIPDDVLLSVFNGSKKIMNILKDKLHCDGFTLVQNNGDIQEVKHFHLHIKPYYNDKKSIELIKHDEFIKDANDIFNDITK